MILAMVENNAGEGVIDAVVNIIAGLAVAAGFADDLAMEVAAEATTNRPGSAMRSVSLEKRRSTSALIFRART
jgi:hypothetical protein